jgi:hypothetical protein
MQGKSKPPGGSHFTLSATKQKTDSFESVSVLVGDGGYSASAFFRTLRVLPKNRLTRDFGDHKT